MLDLQIDKIRFNPVTELAFSGDGRTLAAGGYWYEALWLIDLATRKVRHTIPNAAPGQHLWGREYQGPGFAFTPDGRTLVVGGKDEALHLWDPVTGTEQAALPGEQEPILSLTLTADGSTALTAHRDGALHVWDVASRKHLRKLDATAKYPQFAVLAPDGKTLGARDGNYRTGIVGAQRRSTASATDRSRDRRIRLQPRWDNPSGGGWKLEHYRVGRVDRQEADIPNL